MPISSRLRIDLTYAVALLFLAVGGYLSYRSIHDLRDEQEAMLHAEQVLRAVGDVGSHLKDAETGQRGYLLTRQDEFLEPYRAAIGQIDDDLEELRRLVREPVQREQLSLLEELVRQRLAIADRTLRMAVAGDSDGAIDRVRSGAGREVMNEARVVIRRMEEREFEILRRRQQSASATAQRTVIVVLLTSLVAIGVVTASRRRILADLQARESVEGTLARNEEALRGLYDIASSQEMAFEAKLDALTEVGRRRYGLSIGVLAHIQDELYEVVAGGDAAGRIHPGDVFPVEDTYCTLVQTARDVRAWEEAGSAGPITERAVRVFGLQSYIGAPVTVGGEFYGTLCFGDPNPRRRSFSQSEKDFIRVMSEWVGGEIERRESERNLRESEQRYRRLSEASLEGLAVTEDTRIVDANEAYAEMVGLPLGEIIGRSALDFVAPESRPLVVQRIDSGYDEPYEVVGLRADGTRFYFEVRGKSTTLHGRPVRISALRDVTERKLAEQVIRDSEERYRSLVEAASDIIYRTDLKGYFTYVNPVAVQIMGYSAEQLVEMHYTDLIREDMRETAREFYVTQLRDAIPVTYFEFCAVTAEGREVWIGQNVRLVRERGELVGIQAVARDITRQREVERMKDEFLSVVSHELRTPLTAIRGSLGLLASGKMGQLEERGQRMLEIAAQNTERLVRLINDLLDIEKIESGKTSMEREAVGAAELMTQSAEVMRPLAERAGVRLVVEPLDARLFADPDRIAQVITNLLSNAIKFSPEGGTIHFGGERREGEAVFWVRDEGRGIPEDKRELIFERFQQVDSSDARQKGGTGLGLPIARSIVNQHGGRMWVQSRWGEGSAFFFALPLHGVSAAVSQEPRGPVVLVCEDDPGVRAYVRELLRRGGYGVLVAHSGEETLALAAERHPAAILLDLDLPGMSGREVLAALRRDGDTREIPVVVLTGTGEDSDLDLAEIVGWVQKPIDEASLLRTLEWAVSQKKEHCSVLVVEDDDDLARVVETMVAGRGLSVRRARNGREAIEMSRRLTFGLLVLDPGLPDVDGYGVVDWLRRHNRHRNVPVLVYTARELDDAQRERLRLGPTDFMVKTKVSLEELDQRIAAVFAAEPTEQPVG